MDLPAGISYFFCHGSFTLKKQTNKKKKQEGSDPGATAIGNTVFYFYQGAKIRVKTLYCNFLAVTSNYS